ncbi:YjjG family noncanonical pyrimidine nucleotidase [Anaerosporobacter faecicola]|uniref:YjjG family noncanonical pyrimidine nucleotidase n=1 Tax=Anaerosporobacter faecicola TaxID=2718714 RepID=UPI00143B7F32|nr:YjjG family noncanonical pyrimidine nucleotidase [Anaerosporobacter faecicola]
MQIYRTLLFDVDGTLLDFEKTKERAFRQTWISNSLPFQQEILDTFSMIELALWQQLERGEITKEVLLTKRFQTLFDKEAIDRNPEEFELQYQEELGQYADLIPGAYDICKELAKSCNLYIITNGVAKTQRSRLNRSGLLPFFKDLFISEEVGYSKPRVEFFSYVLSHIPSTAKEEVLVIGDSLTSDIQGGKNAALSTCFVNLNASTNTTNLIPDYEIRDLNELNSIVHI